MAQESAYAQLLGNIAPLDATEWHAHRAFDATEWHGRAAQPRCLGDATTRRPNGRGGPPERHCDGHAHEGVAATGGVRVAERGVVGESSAIFDRAAGGVRHNSLREHRWPVREK